MLLSPYHIFTFCLFKIQKSFTQLSSCKRSSRTSTTKFRRRVHCLQLCFISGVTRLQGLVVVQTIWDEKLPMCDISVRLLYLAIAAALFIFHHLMRFAFRFEKFNEDLLLLDAKVQEFEKRHEEARDAHRLPQTLACCAPHDCCRPRIK